MTQFLRNMLQEVGYNMVALPKSDIQPLLLLTKSGSGEVNSLNDNLPLLFEPDLAPLMMPASDAAPLSVQRNMNFDLKSGVDFLSGIFNALKLGGSQLKAKANADESYTVDFSFQNVQEDKIGLMDLDNFLTGAIPKEGEFRTYEQKLKNSRLFVIYATLKSNEFSLKITDANGQALDVDAVVDQITDVKVDLKRKSDHSFSVVYKKEAPLVFAFKAVQIHYDQKRWFEFWKKAEAGFTIKERRDITLKGPEEFEENTTDLEAEGATIDI